MHTKQGKIFSGSTNIYQDQAKILFDYYKKAAAKIIEEEDQIDSQIANVESVVANLKIQLTKINKQKKIYFSLSFLIIPLFIAIGKLSQAKKLQAAINEQQSKETAYKTNREAIFRDYKVSKLGVAYVPVASRIAFNDKSFIVDHTGIASMENFSLQILRQVDLINESLSQLQDLVKIAPVVEDSDVIEEVDTGEYSQSIQKVVFHNYFGQLDRTLRTISYALSDVDATNVKLPVIYPQTDYANFLEEFGTYTPENAPVFNVFNTNLYNDEIERFNELNATRKSISNDAYEIDTMLRHLIVDIAKSVQTTAYMKVTSANSMVEYSNRILYNILKSPYNFYSPLLEADEIERIKNEQFNYSDMDEEYKPFNLRESSRVRFDINNMCWVSEDGTRTSTPFGISQIQEEIMAPIITNLMKENRKERMAVYNHIKDQKIDYLNKWHQDTEDFYGRNRAESADLINLMRANLSEYTAAYNTLKAFKKTEQSMKEQGSLESAVTETIDNTQDVMAAYQLQSQQFIDAQNDFAAYMERLQDDIDKKAVKFNHIEFYDASLRDKDAHNRALAKEKVGLLDERRKPLAEIDPLLAQSSELPPMPKVENVVYENIAVNLNALAGEVIDDLDTVLNASVTNDTMNEFSYVESDEKKKDIVTEKFDDNEDTVEILKFEEDKDTGDSESQASFSNIDNGKEDVDQIKTC